VYAQHPVQQPAPQQPVYAQQPVQQPVNNAPPAEDTSSSSGWGFIGTIASAALGARGGKVGTASTGAAAANCQAAYMTCYNTYYYCSTHTGPGTTNCSLAACKPC